MNLTKLKYKRISCCISIQKPSSNRVKVFVYCIKVVYKKRPDTSCIKPMLLTCLVFMDFITVYDILYTNITRNDAKSSFYLSSLDNNSGILTVAMS